MQRFCGEPRGLILGALLALLLCPAAARSVELFEGNVGTDSHWLQVLGATSMGERVYWYEVLGDVTYQAQFASDSGFTSLMADFAGITTNYVVPGLGVGSYYFRVRAVDATGTAMPWSRTGTLDVIADVEAPRVAILSPAQGQVYSRGDLLTIQLEVSDDTVLRLAQFTIGGEYVGTLGLKTENSKVVASLGEPRIVSFDYLIPASGGAGSLGISVVASDVADKVVTATTAIELAKSGTGSNGKRRK